MNVTVINAAPRMESGNTHMALAPFVEGMCEAGAQVEVILAARKKIRLCRGCFECYAHSPGVCVQKDDMAEIVHSISQADLFVMATPVYLDGMTALAKTLVDRMVVFLDPHFETDDSGLIHPLRRKFPESMFLVSVCGYPRLHNFEPVVAQAKKNARNFHSRFAGALLRHSAFSLLLTKKYPDRIRDVLSACRNAGSELISQGSVSPDTLARAHADICSEDELMATANAYWDRELAMERAKS